MKGFIEETLDKVFAEESVPSQTTFVLPSKRAGNLVKEYLAQKIDQTSFAPHVFSIEEFIVEITGLGSLDNTQSLFLFYESYKVLTPKENQESFEVFYGWAQTLIYDFNEIDRFVVDAHQLFNYLAEIQDINHWSLAHKEKELIKNYLDFWHKLPRYYDHFTKKILSRKKAYQGLMYRVAAETIEHYLDKKKGDVIFMGFNALNTAEQIIIQSALAKQRAKVYWDTDRSFFNDPGHEASLFLRQYQKNWPYYRDKRNNFFGIADYYSKEKRIETIGIPKNIGQAKYVGEILSNFPKKKLDRTAIVLNDEGLLNPVLNSLPPNVGGLNITMGLPLSKTPLASLFELLFKVQEGDISKIYYKTLVDILNHPMVVLKMGESSKKLKRKVEQKNLIFVSQEKLLEITPIDWQDLIRVIFSDCHQNPEGFLANLAKVTQLLKPDDPSNFPVETEYLYHFHQLFQKLQELLKTNHPIKTVDALHRIYTDSLSSASLDFSGSPFSGLQAMGMLETRGLDFETVILTAVNEGVLPAGKSTNSFIPYDLKKQYGLPTYKEKDAVYTYHFYRLLQRAKNVYLLYNTDQNGLNSGEKSRFISQMETQKQLRHTMVHTMANPIVPAISSALKVIEKTPSVIAQLKEYSKRGFSPSALTTYIRNPIDFYKQYVLGIREPDMVEETVAANTLGTIVHDALEFFYKPFEAKEISKSDLKEMLSATPHRIKEEFQKTYRQAPIDQGKNLLIFEVAKRYVKNFLQTELESLQKGRLKIKHIERNLNIEIKLAELDFPIYLAGKVDRVDVYDGIERIIDYKTGKVLQTDLNLPDWGVLTSDFKYSKAFQVLCYARMMQDETALENVQAGIISLKNLKSGFLKFTDKSVGKRQQIDMETLASFDKELELLIVEIMNPDVPFTEKIV